MTIDMKAALKRTEEMVDILRARGCALDERAAERASRILPLGGCRQAGQRGRVAGVCRLRRRPRAITGLVVAGRSRQHDLRCARPLMRSFSRYFSCDRSPSQVI